ncbi:DUF4350 domain-containing protein [Micromonospora peucetia]|uniref:DUF4350 domain-containing protein n=1 Tax=Micromonospora peucetia TaxID=47871 RepID=A0A1C6UDL1_9ACTN|nr:DUF4350 domain-containing protein [Micromonospora peucetia]WSA33880.1 DUF4350 domain-containing protein [Micromonospora peucetia]SCL52092.1 hypothetical protein GA0070608_0960 [Micromonospora peucetia]
MSAQVTTAPPVRRADVTGRRRRRRHRLLIPLGLAALLLTTTLVTHAVDQPDPGDRGFLSPVATGDDGGSRLADALRERGVTVQRETDTLRALLAARSPAATLFVPAPALLHPDTVGALDSLPSATRLVLVDPPRRVLAAVGLPMEPAGRRWAAQAVGPDARGLPCPLPELRQLGRVAVGLQRYAVAPGGSAPDRFCFADGLALLPRFPESTVLVGASDPFRNDRIDEWDNRAFATALLGGSGRVVWLDLDGPEPPPTFGNGSSGSPSWSPTPGGSTGNGGPGSGTGDGNPGRPGGNADDGSPGGESDGEDEGDSQAGGSDPPNPLWSAFPSWLWALLAQLAVAALLAALWRARRLGPPTPEPLPVTVRSAETVLGRARLYQRAGARDSVARTLRTAALDRLTPRLHLPPTAPPTDVAAAVAARTGDDPGWTDEVLHGAEPETDQDLLDLARALDRLTRTVAPPATDGPPPAAPQPHRAEGDPR